MATSETYWNKRAHLYDGGLTKGPNYANRIERAAALIKDTDNVLDVGCASGDITLDIAPHAHQIQGIDQSARMIELANQKAKDRGTDNARFSHMDAFNPSLAEGSFQVITAVSVIHFLKDTPATFARLHGLLAPGGHLLIETPCIGEWSLRRRIRVRMKMITGKSPKIRIMKVAELESMITTVGFEILESKIYNPVSRLQCILARKR